MRWYARAVANTRAKAKPVRPAKPAKVVKVVRKEKPLPVEDLSHSLRAKLRQPQSPSQPQPQPQAQAKATGGEAAGTEALSESVEWDYRNASSDSKAAAKALHARDIDVRRYLRSIDVEAAMHNSASARILHAISMRPNAELLAMLLLPHVVSLAFVPRACPTLAELLRYAPIANALAEANPLVLAAEPSSAQLLVKLIPLKPHLIAPLVKNVAQMARTPHSASVLHVAVQQPEQAALAREIAISAYSLFKEPNGRAAVMHVLQMSEFKSEVLVRLNKEVSFFHKLSSDAVIALEELLPLYSFEELDLAVQRLLYKDPNGKTAFEKMLESKTAHHYARRLVENLDRTSLRKIVITFEKKFESLDVGYSGRKILKLLKREQLMLEKITGMLK